MKLNAIVIICVLCLSCRHEESSDTDTFIENKTPYRVIIREFSNASIIQEFNINSMEKKKVLSRSSGGKGRGYSYASYLSFNDSTEVVYDNSIRMVHYSYKESKNQPFGIKYDSSRSLYNEDNYIRNILQEDKFTIYNAYTYIITNQDYLDAQNQ